ncbi:metallophosphoesterase [Granulosicoccus sp.]|nr:metallophosphoesterase [Granulosicoccus sp.]MDB4223478.1 metallophosphoesterase [Granulosicoccus sp.]
MITRNNLTAGCLLALASITLNSAAIAAPIKVAFIGDQGIGDNARAVLTLVANEGTDLLLIQGDLGYKANAAGAWNENLTNALGSDFPVLAVVGNHENFEWPLYKRHIQRRIDQNVKLDCVGNTGVKALCQFGNIEIVQVASGINEVDGVKGIDDYQNYIRSQFASSSPRWRICSWHKNQRDMQPAAKGDSTGWEIYEACLDAGAMITMAHAHSYSRTHLLSNFEQKTIVNKSSDMTLKPGQSFAFVSGLGGRDVVSQEHGGDWFASIYTASQGATHGALFCTFDIATADCYFKAIDGAIPDRFTLKLDSVLNPNVSQLVPPPPATQPDSAFVFSRSDVTEFRWIDWDTSGKLASTWISESCAAELGGPKVTGDWTTLTEIAPSFNDIETPCEIQTTIAESTIAAAITRDAGYVFSRTDATEYRWIDRDDNGTWSNIWIHHSCADELGGPTVTGDWNALIEIAPAFDTIDSPCGTIPTIASASSASSLETTSPGRFNDIGYVYSRTDKTEYRWIARDNNGAWGSIWISEACANRLGGPKATGDWFELMDEAPGFDSIPSPCS